MGGRGGIISWETSVLVALDCSSLLLEGLADRGVVLDDILALDFWV